MAWMRGMVPFIVVLLATLLVSALRATDSWALWPSSPQASLSVSAVTGEQRSQVIATDGADGAFIAWEDVRSSPSDLYAQRMTAGGEAAWTIGGIAICNAGGAQSGPVILADGSGGAFIGWSDTRTGSGADVYVQRTTSSGSASAGWPVNGLGVCSAANTQALTGMVTDGQGGAILVWYDQRSGNNDIYAQRVSAAGAVAAGWTANGVLVCTGASQQVPADIAPDGTGGAFIVWHDDRSGNPDVYLQRISAAGAVAAGWPANGLAICTVTNEQRMPRLALDGSGGVFVSWEDLRSDAQGDLYALHVLADGTRQVGWALNGNLVAGGYEYQGGAAMVSDGVGGVFLAWTDARNWAESRSEVYGIRLNTLGGVVSGWTSGGSLLRMAASLATSIRMTSDGSGGVVVVWDDSRDFAASVDVFALRVSGSGTIVPGWTQNGTQVCGAPNFQGWTSIAPSGSGGVVIAWKDQRNDLSDVYAQRLGPLGQLGPEPRLLSVSDVVNDQGGNVVLEWAASYLEAAAPIASYSVWRRIPGHAMTSTIMGSRHRMMPVATITGHSGVPPSTDAVYWEYVASLPARRFPGYSFVAATTSDSLPGSNPYTSFQVLAETGAGSWWASNGDSGYSVDNLPPPVPTPFSGEYAAGTTTLDWGLSTVPDFATFRLYRGSTANFVPGAGNLVIAQVDTRYVDPAGQPYYYKLAAVDIHGNESGHAVLTPGGMVDVLDTAPLAFALEGVRPNPTASSRMAVSIVLPSPTSARLELVDVTGRMLVGRDVGALGVGRHVVDLAAGRKLRAGIYLVRLTQGSLQRTARVIVLK